MKSLSPLASLLLATTIAASVLVLFVLPAEYGLDPLGAGEKLGLTALSDQQQTALQSRPEALQQDSRRFVLAPFEAVEYKYRLEQGAAFLYQWRASGEVLYDMHSEPDGAAPGFAQSFAKSRDTKDSGTYVAPFSGIHGWFWQNRGKQEVTVELETKGFYPYAVQFSDGRDQRVEFSEKD